MIKNMCLSNHIRLLLCLVGLVSSCSKSNEETNSLPNIVLFLVDDLGWKDLSGYGNDLYLTPHTDELALQGVKFTNAYAASTVCSPTRASILTGKYPARLHCTDWISGHEKPFARLAPPDWTQHIRDKDETIAEALKKIGYNTIHIGKWHLGEEEKYWPEYHGFDQNVGGWKVGMPKRKQGIGGYFVPYHNPRLSDGSEGEYLTERLAKETVQFIQKNKDTPFFINFWFYNVHTPLQAKAEKIARYDSLACTDGIHFNATYAAMVEHMDEAIGSVVGALKRAGMYENTIIVFASDNGGLIGNKGDLSKQPKVTSNAPLRSGKGDMYEGGVRTPFIVSWPKKIPSGGSSDILSISTDIYPTLLGLIGKGSELPAQVDGIDLTDHLISRTRPDREAIYWHYPHYHTEGAVPYGAIRSENWKLLLNYENQQYELYDLNKDIGEENNLANDFPDKVEELKEKLNVWKKEVNAQEPLQNESFDPLRSHKWKNK